MIVERNGNAAQQHLGVRQLGLFIFRQVHGNGMAQFGKRLRQSAYNISQSAGFSERHALRSGKNDFHGASVAASSGTKTCYRKF